MNRLWIKQGRMISVMLSLLLACLFAGIASANHAPSISFSPTFTDTFISDNHLNDTQAPPAENRDSSPESRRFDVEQRAPAKSLAPSLASILRNGSFVPERLHEAEPTYELVFDFSQSVTSSLVWRVYLALDHWHDWTLNPPSTLHRIAGWKESNIIYRFIAQADA